MPAPHLALLLFAAQAVAPAAPATQTPLPAKVAAATSARDKMICKRYVKTGSLVDSTRICKTQAEWDRDQANIRAGINASNSCRDFANGSNC